MNLGIAAEKAGAVGDAMHWYQLGLDRGATTAAARVDALNRKLDKDGRGQEGAAR